jgi:AraC-like DNA-binding protein
MTVIVRRPALGGLVREICYRAGEQPHASVEKILPGPETGLWVNLNRDEFRSFEIFAEGGQVRRVPGAMLSGPASRARVIEFEQGHGHVSVTFALGAAGCFVGFPLAEARDDLVPLENVWVSGTCLRERLLEAGTPGDALAVMEGFLVSRLVRAGGPDPAVIAAAGALSRGAAVGAVCDDLGLLPRTLRRRFTAQVGLTPKRFARVQRLRRLVRDLEGLADVDWAAAAARHGYADQPHLADEFRALAGVTPSEYLCSRIDGPNHLRVPMTV